MKYFKQEKFYTCGPAVARMVMSKFGKDFTEQELEEQFMGFSTFGTSPEILESFFRSHGLKTESGEEGSLELLDKFLKEDCAVIIAYEIEVPHFACYVGRNASHVFLHDPFLGEKYAWEQAKFKRKWKVDQASLTKAKLALMDLFDPSVDLAESKELDKWYLSISR